MPDVRRKKQDVLFAAKMAEKIARWYWQSQVDDYTPSRRLHDIGASDREVRLFFTFISAVDYMRDASTLWRNGEKLFESHRELFDPDQVSRMSHEKFVHLLKDGRVSQRHGQDTKAWRTIAKNLSSAADDSPIRRLIDRGGGNAKEIVNDLQSCDIKGNTRFPLLRGDKIGPMWMQIMADPNQGGAKIDHMDVIPVAVDVHVRRVTENLGITDTRDLPIETARPIIQNIWRKVVETIEIGGPPGIAGTCAALDPALWEFGRRGCSDCERIGRRAPIISSVCDHCVRFPR